MLCTDLLKASGWYVAGLVFEALVAWGSPIDGDESLHESTDDVVVVRLGFVDLTRYGFKCWKLQTARWSPVMSL